MSRFTRIPFAEATTTPSSPLRAGNLTCSRDNAAQLLLLSWIFYAGPAIIILLVYSFMQKRTRLCLKCCWGMPSILVPINLLDSKENRFVSVCAFGATASSMLSLLTVDFGSVTRIAALQSLLTIFFVVILAVVYSPIFVCIDAPNRISGYVVGFLYTLGWLGVQSVYFALCGVANSSAVDLAVQILIFLPVFLCLGLVLIWFLYMLFKSIAVACRKSKVVLIDEDVDRPYQADYVEKLLKRQEKGEVEEEEEESKFKAFMNRILYKWDKDFKYPTRILATYLIAAIFIFQLSVITLNASSSWADSLTSWLNDIDVDQIRNDYLRRILEGIEKISAAWIGSFFTSCLVSTAISVVFLLRMMTSYRKEMKRLYKGDKSFLPANLPSPTSTVLATFKYSGYQIAYIFWGWFIIMLVLLIGCFIVALCIYWIEIDYKSFLAVVYVLLAPCIFSLLLWLFQFLFVKYSLLQEKGKDLALTNRRLYHSVVFFFVFYNVILGIWSCLLRLIYSLGFGVLFVSRLDLSVLPKGLDMLDPGYKVYVGYLVMDYHHTNPILVSFAYIIRKSVEDKRIIQSDTEMDEVKMEESLPGQSKMKVETASYKRARNRWLVAVTLMRNPDLKADRYSGNEFKPRKRDMSPSLADGKKKEASPEEDRRTSTLPLVSEEFPAEATE